MRSNIVARSLLFIAIRFAGATEAMGVSAKSELLRNTPKIPPLPCWLDPEPSGSMRMRMSDEWLDFRRSGPNIRTQADLCERLRK